MQMEIHPTKAPRPKPHGDLGFGTIFTDHVFRMQYAEGAGWAKARIEPYGPISLDPAASVLHYAQTVFEGLKAFAQTDGSVKLFRPDRHAARMHRSCQKLCIPPVPEEVFLEAVQQLVSLERGWVPTDAGAALYIRPFVYATEAFLGVRPAKHYNFDVICSPVGAYYATGFAPVKIWVERDRVRASPGGVGDAKTAGNYAASLEAAQAAKARGYAQVLWTDAREHRYVEEVGTMNLFVVLGDEVVTPPLGGTILPGVTRASVLHMLRAEGANVQERPLTIDEIREGHAKGTLKEIFGTGTAAVVSAVGVLGFEDGDLTIGDGGVGPLARRLFDEVQGIQRGTREDRFGWMHPVK